MAEIRVLNSVGATVTIDGVERESVTVDAGTTVHWKVSKEGYVTQEGDYTVLEDTVLPVVLKREEYTITFNVSPTDATLTVNGSEVTLSGGTYTMTAHDGDVIEWSCEKDGYIQQSGSHTVNGDATITITLEEEAAHYITVEPTSLELEANPRLLDENVTVSSDGSWTAAAAASWVTLSQTSGDAGETAILVSAESNADTSARSTTVTITSEHGETATLNVSQKGKSSGGGGGGGTTYPYTVVNNTSDSVDLGIYDSKGMIKLTVTVQANGTATFTTDEEITSETEFYVAGDVGTSYSVSVQGSTIYIDYGTTNSSSDAEAYSEGEGNELELSGE